jgi:hypothetical protein
MSFVDARTTIHALERLFNADASLIFSGNFPLLPERSAKLLVLNTIIEELGYDS